VGAVIAPIVCIILCIAICCIVRCKRLREAEEAEHHDIEVIEHHVEVHHHENNNSNHHVIEEVVGIDDKQPYNQNLYGGGIGNQ
jgi:hypothetical protein